MLVELHAHSTFSDGSYTPTRLVEECAAKDIGILAITDHDSWEGVPEAAAAAARFAGKVRIIPGIELSTQEEGLSVHILGYHVDITCRRLYDKMLEMRHGRELRLAKMLAKLETLGYSVTAEECEPDNRAVGRPHVAKALVSKGYFKTVREAFDALLYNGGPAYVPNPKLSVEEAAALIHLAGGAAILAHPSELRDKSLPARLFQKKCLEGIEVYHPSADAAEQRKWLELADEYNLLIGGGSDFHGLPDRFPRELGQWKVAAEQVGDLINFRRQHPIIERG